MNTGIQNSLISKLSAVERSMTEGRTNQAKHTFSAFLNEVEAQTGKALTEDQAMGLKRIASRIIF